MLATIFTLILAAAARQAEAACTSNDSSTDQLQSLLTNGGAGYTLSLCAGQVYNLSKTLNYTAMSQVRLYHYWRVCR